jgi:hypothetical protein
MHEVKFEWWVGAYVFLLLYTKNLIGRILNRKLLSSQELSTRYASRMYLSSTLKNLSLK